MSSNRPYLLRALYQWIGDNNMTPHILVDAGVTGVEVPEHAIQKGKVILNIDQAAVRELAQKQDLILVCGRYEGVDERFAEQSVDEEISIGDYILTGGELAGFRA